MKAIFLLMMLVSTSAFDQNNVDKVEWLVGTWNRTNAKPGRSGVEIWTKKNNELIGRGINLKGTDTTFVEKLKIVSKDGKLFYVSDVPENKTEIWFEFTSISENGFVVENTKHDFPKKIAYELKGNDLKATISGDGKSIDFLFTRKSN